MKILFAHNFYQIAGGEDTVIKQEMKLLESSGHDVELYSINNDQIKGIWNKLRIVMDLPYSHRQFELFSDVIRQFEPDVVHVHNFFPLLTPSIYDACHKNGVAIVQTLHNYRTMCAGALLLRDGKICEDCINSTPYKAVLHRCYRNSFFGSLAVSKFISQHRKQDTWSTKVDRLIALTDFSKEKFIESGISPDRLIVKPNFIDDPLNGAMPIIIEQRSGVLFIGRLSEEKGIKCLLDAWEDVDVPLTIAGTGPMQDIVSDSNCATIRYIGSVSRDQVTQEMARARILVVPSVWYEGFPMVLLEAFATGLPVIATDLGNVGQIVAKHVAGRLFASGNPAELQHAVNELYSDTDMLQQFSDNARSAYEAEYTPAKNLQLLEEIYSQTILSFRETG